MEQEISTIKYANKASRLFALIMDAILFFFVTAVLVYFVTMPIAGSAMGYNELQSSQLQYRVFSKLYVCEEKIGDNITILNINEYDQISEDAQLGFFPLSSYKKENEDGSLDINFYKERVKYYYLNFKVNENIEYPTSAIDETVKTKYYAPDYLNNRNSLNEANVLSIINAMVDEETVVEACENALSDLNSAPYYVELENQYKWCQVFVYFVPFVLSFSIFYLLIPLLMKDGETLGKKTMGISLISNDGYKVKKRQIVFRQILIFVYIFLFMFYVGINIITSFAFLALAMAIYVIFIIFNKKGRSFIDLAAYTLLVDSRSSVWFKSPGSEENAIEKINTELSKTKKFRNKKISDK